MCIGKTPKNTQKVFLLLNDWVRDWVPVFHFWWLFGGLCLSFRLQQVTQFGPDTPTGSRPSVPRPRENQIFLRVRILRALGSAFCF